MTEEKLDELSRATELLARTKATDQRILKSQKKVFDKAMVEMINKNKALEE